MARFNGELVDEGTSQPRFKGKEVKEGSEEYNKILGTITSVGQGASFGFSDEIAGGLQSLFPYPYGTKDSGGYETAVKGVRDQQKQFAEESPVLDFTGNLAGGLLTGVGGGARTAGTKFGQTVMNNTKNMNNMLKFGLAGSGGGAVSGYGYADKDEGLKGAAIGAGTGFGLGALTPPLISATGKVVDVASRPIRNAIESQSSPTRSAANKISKAFARDEIPLDTIQGTMKNGKGDLVLADVGGENVLGLTEAIATMPGKAKNQALNQLRERQVGQGQRIEKIIFDNISDTKATVQLQDDIARVRSEQAKPLYDAAYAVEDVSDEAINNVLLRLPDDTFEALKDISRTEGLIFPNIIQTAKDGTRKVVSGYGVRDIDTIKRGLDELIDQGIDSVTGKVSPRASRLLELKSQLLKNVDEKVPEYAAARKVFSDSKGLEDAMMKGRKFFNTDYDITEKMVANMSDAEKDFYKMGVVRDLTERLNKKIDSGDKTRLFNKQDVRNKLKPLFDTDDALDGFLNQIESEQRKSLTYTRASGNSRTAGRQAAQEDLQQGDLPQGQSMWEMGFNALFGKERKLNEPMADEIGRLLLSKDPRAVNEAMGLLRAPRENIIPRLSPIQGAGLLSQQSGYLSSR